MNLLAAAVSGKTSPKECDMQEIKKLVQQYPYFAPAQFLLLQQLKDEDPAACAVQAQRAVLYYHDPMEFELFMNTHRFETVLPFDLLTEETLPDTAVAVADDDKEAVVVDEDLVEATPVEADTPAEETITDLHVDTEPTEELPEAKPEEEKEPEALAEPAALVAVEEFPAPEREETRTDEESRAGNALAGLLTNLQTGHQVTENDLISFEPYHTIDYFASQGIKLQQEEVPKDKFGKQLRSFTEWLKTMKRLPGQPPPSSVDAATEKNVQHMAEGSVNNPEVATEAMAEVWLKQGNTAKAAQVYQKLSLQNPSKKAYFAAKIENLKY